MRASTQAQAEVETSENNRLLATGRILPVVSAMSSPARARASALCQREAVAPAMAGVDFDTDALPFVPTLW